MISALALALVLALPLVLTPLCLLPATRSFAAGLAPWAAAPALALALLGDPAASLTAPALLLGTHLGLDEVGRAFLLLTAIVALLAGWSMRTELRADPGRFRFAAFYLAGLAGNLGAILAHDIVSFYTFFALMTFSAYGLVVHRNDAAARYAGRVYIVLVVLGEGMLLAAFVLIAAAGGLSLSDAPQAVAASPYRDWIIALLLGGFGAKAGLLPLHVSLPLAYAAAPVAGAVLLAGAMIKAGLLGWMRFLPLGLAELPQWGAVLTIAGLSAIFYAAAVGLVQRDAKAMLAYSSISQMGFMTAALGLAFIAPALWPAVASALLVYAMHHAIVKSTLFLGVAAAAGPSRNAIVVVSILPALVLAGAPFTGGAIAKTYLKDAVHLAPVPWAGVVEFLLPFGAFATAVLMARFLYALWHEAVARAPRPLFGGIWLTGMVLSFTLVWFLPAVEPRALLQHWRAPSVLWQETWPALAAAVAAFATLRLIGQRRMVARLPPGDVLIAFEWLWRVLESGGCAIARRAQRVAGYIAAERGWVRYADDKTIMRWQERMQAWPLAGFFFVLVVVAVLMLLIPWR